MIRQSKSLQIKNMSFSKTMADYVQNYIKKMGPDNVQQYKRDDNAHQHNRKNIHQPGRFIPRIEMEHLLLGETAMIPKKCIKLEEVCQELNYILCSPE